MSRYKISLKIKIKPTCIIDKKNDQKQVFFSQSGLKLNQNVFDYPSAQYHLKAINQEVKNFVILSYKVLKILCRILHKSGSYHHLLTKNVYAVNVWVDLFIRRSLQATYNNLFYQFRFIVLRHILGAFRVFVLFLFLYYESNLI